MKKECISPPPNKASSGEGEAAIGVKGFATPQQQEVVKCLYCERDMIKGSECLNAAQAGQCDMAPGRLVGVSVLGGAQVETWVSKAMRLADGYAADAVQDDLNPQRMGLNQRSRAALLQFLQTVADGVKGDVNA